MIKREQVKKKMFLRYIGIGILVMVILGYVINNQRVASLSKQSTEENHEGYEEPAPQGEITVIDIEENGVFEPQTITIKKNTTIAFKNEDDNVHRIISDADDLLRFDSGDIAVDQQLSVVQYDKAGTYTYYSKLYPHEKGTIIVEE